MRGVPGVHEGVSLTPFANFLFLYPSTFNILEVAAIDEPELHLWETGVIRITRHPQMVGQLMWCFAHCLWIGNSFTIATSSDGGANYSPPGDSIPLQDYLDGFQTVSMAASGVSQS